MVSLDCVLFPVNIQNTLNNLNWKISGSETIASADFFQHARYLLTEICGGLDNLTHGKH